MNADDDRLEDLIRTFASRWERLGEPGTSEDLLADPVLVLGAEGTTPVPRQAFLAAVAARSQAVSAAPTSSTTVAAVAAQPVGERMVLATISWTFSQGTGSVSLVSDFLLLRQAAHTLRCVAYLPRTNVLDHLPAPEAS
ncbi:hypothetical protein [Propionicimonas sp.]|uniref:hypothetical protein n=1 Tax=Propionicimonas sp. TaxID=1955623 RepID=UPI0039E6C6CF